MDVSQKQKDFWGVIAAIFVEIIIVVSSVFYFLHQDYYGAFFLNGIWFVGIGRRIPERIRCYREEAPDAPMREMMANQADIVFNVVCMVICVLGVIKIRDPVWLPIACGMLAVWLVIQFPKLLRGYKRYRRYQEFGQ